MPNRIRQIGSSRRVGRRRRLLIEELENRQLLAAIRGLPGFLTNQLPANDDSSVGPVQLGLTGPINYFGTNTTTAFVNNNGNITFDSALSTYTPFTLNNTNRKILAPFFGDVDTSRGAVVRYGNDTVNGRPAFGVEWPGVGFYSSNISKLNRFELIIIDRADTGTGNFDVEFNYDQIRWEAGDLSGGINGLGGTSARVGFASGTNGPFREFVGSAINGALLDTNATTGLIYNRYRSNQPGRYVLTVRGGAVVDPDLQVDSVTVLGTGIASGNDVTVQWVDKNFGNDLTPTGWSDRVRVINRATSAVVVDQLVIYDPLASGNGAIAPGSSRTRTTTFRLPDGTPGTGTFDVTVSTDALNQIFEANSTNTSESNNSRLGSFSSILSPYPALSVATISVPPNSQFSVPFDVTWSVLNSGNAALTKSIRDRVYLSVDDRIDASDRILATVNADSKLPLAVGASYSQTSSVTLPLDVSIPPGAYQILVQTDFANEQFEFNETNNFLATPITVSLPPLPDLVVDSITARTLMVAGQSTNVTWVVKNQGAASAVGPWNDRVYLSNDGVIGGDILLSTFPVSETILPSGFIERIQSIQIPPGLSGEYRFVVATDIGNTIQEFNNEGNNVSIDDAVITIDPRPSPNLVIDSVTSLTSNLFTGQPATVEWIVRNIGNASTDSIGWVDRVYLSTDGVFSNEDIYLGQVQNPSYLNVDENYRNSLTVTLPQDQVGARNFIVVTDAQNRIEETAGEDDNIRASATAIISLTDPPDLYVTQVTRPDQANEGEPIIVNWTVRNQGTGATRVGQWTDQVFLSVNNQEFDAADILLTTVTRLGDLPANNAEYTVSGLSILLPENVVSNNAYLFIRTDASGAVYEHNFENNNVTRTLLPMQISLRPRPDLAVESIVPVSTASAGQPLVVSYRVTNNSVMATRESFWQDSIYLSIDRNLSQDDLLLGQRGRNGILQGEQSEDLSYNFVLDDRLQGDFYLIVSADSTGNILEYDDVNNILVAANPTRVVINPPDLVASSVRSSTAAKAGRQLPINYDVTNTGGNPTPQNNWTDAYYLSMDDKFDDLDHLLGSRRRNGVLVPNQVENTTTNLQLPTDRFGSNFVFVLSDSSDQVYELNNDNNISSLPIFIEDDRPDLVVRSFAPRISNRSIAPGSSVAFDFEVANKGLGPTFGRSWTDRVVLSSDLIFGNGDDVIVGNYTSPTDLAAGRTYFRRSENLTIPSNTPEGLYRLFLVTDAGGGVAELNEANNALISADFTVTTTTTDGQLSDLQVTALTAPATASSGGTLPISWTVKNNGVAPTSTFTWTDSIWLSTDASIDDSDIFVGSFTHYNTLNVNASYSRTINWPIDIDLSGNYFTIVQIDSSDSVLEGVGESNNKAVSSNTTDIALSQTADLQIASITAPPQAFSGRALGLSWTTANAGGGTAIASWADSVYLSLDQIFDPGTDIPIGYLDRTSNLAGGLNYTANSTLTVPVGLGGTYYAIVVTDATNRVYERKQEGNNIGIASQPISIVHTPPADLVVGSITIPANGEIGQSASISFTITNIGQNLARGGWYDSIYISTDETWDIDDGYFGRVFRSADVPANTSYTSSLTAPLPGVLPGKYKVIIRSDIRNNLVEDNEANNLQASLDTFATDVSLLTLGTPKPGTIATNQGVYYRVDVAAGETLAIEFDSANAEGSTELYASFNAVPRRSFAQFSALKPYQADQRIVISSTQAGTYYILAFGNDVTSGSSNFSILARTVQFTVFDTSYGQGGTAGDRTILIEGAKFDRSVTATLVDSAGRESNATRYTRVSDTRLYATFDLRALATGNYAVRFTKESTSATVLVPNSLEVVFATTNLQPISLTRPDTFNRRRGDRVPATIPVTVAWRNNTLNDIAVPLIHFSATDPFALTLEDANATPTKTIYSTEFLGFTESDGPKDILLAGEFSSASFYVRPVKVEATSPLIDIHYVSEYFYNDATANYVWDYDLSQLDLSYLSDAEAIDAIQAFKAERGSTVGALRQALMEGLQRTGETSKEIPGASRHLLQEVFDRFVATRQTSIAGAVTDSSLATTYKGLVVTLSEVGGTQRYSSAILADGSFVFPKLPAANYAVSISGGSVKAPDGLRVNLAANEHSQLTIPLEIGPPTTAVTLAPRVPSGISRVAAPSITEPGKINEVLEGNALESVLPELAGVPYRVELIGDAPLGFTLGSDGQYRYLSSENTAFVVHYDLVTPDTETRVGRLFTNEIRSRGAIAITLKNNFTRDVRAFDPNDIIGPVGYGPEKWVSASERLPYTIRYENDPKNATAAAQVVRIVQVLDSDLDPNSFQFGDFGFGGREFSVPTGRQSLNMDLNLVEEIGIIVRVFARIDVATREISWTFSSISPSTGTDTTNPDDGFLPLNLTPPQGDGFVSYSIRAKRTATTGSKITASARIIFDGNTPLDTPEIFNTLDATRPTSAVASAEPVLSESRLRVKWAGSDGDIGAGLSVYDVYVSENSGRYTPWLQNTKLIDAEYIINATSTYDFVTIAKDNVGNGESETKLPDVQRPVAFIGGPYAAIEGVSLTLNGSGQDPDADQTLSYEWDFDFDGTNFQAESTLQRPSIVFNDGPGSRTIALRVKDNGTIPLTSSIVTTTVSIANAAPVLTQNAASVTGGVLTTLRNTGTWQDVAVDLVALTASLGTITKNGDGTWSWSYVPPDAIVNRSVTITAKDKDNAQSTVSFTITAIAPSFKPVVSSTEPSITGNQSVVVTIDFTKPVTGFALEDLNLLNATASGLVDLGGGRFNVTLQAQSEGLVRLSVKANSVLDAQGGINIESDTLAWTYIDVSQSDFGDAPSALQSGFANSYPTLLQQDGPRHKSSGLRLGSSMDSEPNGLPTLVANGDDTNGVDDEDGIAFGMPIIASRSLSNISSLKATASGAGKLDAWIDFNRDGDWNDAGEQILVSTPVSSGSNLVSFAIPNNASAGTTYARFRISSAGGLSPNGSALDGEVEDYAVQVLDGETAQVLTLLATDVGSHELLVIAGKLTVRSASQILFSASADKVDKVTLLGTGNSMLYEVVRPSTNLVGTVAFVGEGSPVRYSIPSAVIETSSFLGAITGVGEMDLTGNSGQDLRLNLASVRGLNASKTMKVVADRDDKLTTDRGWKFTQSRLDNGKLVHGFGNQDAKLELQNFSPWQNWINKFDVNGDDSVDPLDVLTIINQINSRAGTADSGKLPDFNPATPSQFSFLDVDADNSLSPLDVLQVINFINSRVVSRSGEGEGTDRASNQSTDSVFASYANFEFENEQSPQARQRRFRQK